RWCVANPIATRLSPHRSLTKLENWYKTARANQSGPCGPLFLPPIGIFASRQLPKFGPLRHHAVNNIHPTFRLDVAPKRRLRGPMDRYICIHAHFYQPPRENPWLEEVERQDSAYPYHDWDARIDAECYAPNAASRILDGSGMISQIVNNYSRISFNFGPTLLSWMQENAPGTYDAILESDV